MSDELAEAAFVASLPEDPCQAMIKISERFDALSQLWRGCGAHHMLARSTEALYFVYEFLDRRWPIQYEKPALGSSPESDYGRIARFFGSLGERARREHEESTGRERYARMLREPTIASFGNTDWHQVQSLINQLRDLIRSATWLSAEHRQRLLARLEKMQQELHKETSSLDRTWAFLGEAARVLGKAGKDAKPLLDRVRELMDVIGRVAGWPASLPSDSKSSLPPIEHESRSNPMDGPTSVE